jgi:hypothetical protein
MKTISELDKQCKETGRSALIRNGYHVGFTNE